MNKKRKKNSNRFNFHLENPHYRRLHLILYFVSVLLIFSVYIIVITFFSDMTIKYFLIGFFSILLGVYLVFNRDNIVRQISDRLEDNKRKKLKKNNQDGLKTTLKRIKPKNKNLKFTITNKTTFKEKMNNAKSKFKKKDKKEKDYIEIE